MSAQETPTVIGADLKAFLEAEVMVFVGTRAADLAPEVVFGWSPRVVDNGRELDIFIDRAAGARALENLRATRLIAVTCSSPITVHATQLKGWCSEIEEPAPEDPAWVGRQRQAFMESMRLRSTPEHVSRSLWSRDFVRVRISVGEVFDQTPGPGAGKKL